MEPLFIIAEKHDVDFCQAMEQEFFLFPLFTERTWDVAIQSNNYDQATAPCSPLHVEKWSGDLDKQKKWDSFSAHESLIIIIIAVGRDKNLFSLIQHRYLYLVTYRARIYFIDNFLLSFFCFQINNGHITLIPCWLQKSSSTRLIV